MTGASKVESTIGERRRLYAARLGTSPPSTGEALSIGGVSMQSSNKTRLSQLVSGMSEEEAAGALADLAAGVSLNTIKRPGGEGGFENRLVIDGRKMQDLRYGENPHQTAALYASSWPPRGLAGARQLHGPAVSFTNWLDADAGMGLVADFERPAAAIIKHTNPCGFAVAEDIARAYQRAFACDPRAAYGGVVALNRPLDEELAGSLAESFLNVLVTPAVTGEAATKLRKGLRLLVLDRPTMASQMDVRSIDGGLLVQTTIALLRWGRS